MKWNILHESRGRMRLHLNKKRMSLAEADQLQDYLTALPSVRTAAVYERTCDVVVVYTADRAGVVKGLAAFKFDVEALAEVPANSPRAVNREYQEKLVNMTIFHFARKLFLPAPLRMVYTLVRSVPYIFRGLRCVFRRKLEVEVLDALSIGVSMLRGDFGTAGSVMFLLRLGELLEEWTRKKSLGDLARCMSLNVDRVWQQTAEGEVLVPISQVCAGDAIVVHTGSVIPLDGRVLDGEASVNQASLTGEAEPVRKSEGAVVYAGTVVEEGQITVTVEQQAGNGRYDQIVKMIENSEKLKSASETRAAALADKLVPYSLLGTAVTYALTRNATRAISILMVDFSCALKLSMPLAVLSAMRECGSYHITVKGGKYLEALANADTIVFDKTGTLTHATPTVVQVVPFGTRTEDEVLQIAACLEEHYPHSMANAVVQAASAKGIRHDEMHSEVQYVVAHGIASQIGGEKAVIGSQHFVFEDEGCCIPTSECGKFDALPPEYSHLYLAIGGVLYLLDSAWGYGGAEVPAPQATLMKMIVEGIMGGNLPWNLVFTGVFLAIALEVLRIPVMPFAIGLYLPIYLNTSIMIGGAVRWFMDSRKNVDAKLKEEQTTRGTLFCAGMIAGEGLVGILLAVFAVFGISTALSIDLGNIGGVVLMIVMIACLLAFSMKKKKN